MTLQIEHKQTKTDEEVDRAILAFAKEVGMENPFLNEGYESVEIVNVDVERIKGIDRVVDDKAYEEIEDFLQQVEKELESNYEKGQKEQKNPEN
jgi:hypothetical protein